MYFKQIDEIVSGAKTCTQRCEKPGESYHCNEDGQIVSVFDANGRTKWHVGDTYAVSPGRGRSGLWVKWDHPTSPMLGMAANRDGVEDLRRQGYQLLRIRIHTIEHVRVQTTDERVAIAEGVGSVQEYATLWRTINGKGETFFRTSVRWEDNPLVWRLWFELAKDKAA